MASLASTATVHLAPAQQRRSSPRAPAALPMVAKVVPELLHARLDHVGLSVHDLPGLAAWYVNAFGLVEEAQFAYEFGSRQVKGALLASKDGWRLELQQCEGSESSGASTPLQSLLRQGLGHFCLRVPDLDEAFARLVGHGATVAIRPTRAPITGVRIGYLADPERNLIELLEQSEAARA